MSSEAITRNDLTAILNEVLPSTKPTVIQAKGSGNVSTTSDTITQIPLVSSTAVYNNTNDAEVDEVLGGIKIKTTGLYKVQGSIYLTTGANALLYGVYLKKSANGGNYASSAEIYGGMIPARASSTIVNNSPAILISCDANDVIFLAGRVTNATGTISAGNRSTLIRVERVV